MAGSDRHDLAAALARFNAGVLAPRAYGVHDCCLAVADVLAVAWGSDPMARFRGRYSSEAGFKRLLAREKCRDLLAGVALGAADCGAVEIFPGSGGEPQEFDLGFVLFEDGERSSRSYGGWPAFHFEGFFRGLAPGGFAATPTAHRVWRLPGGIHARA